MNALRRFAPGEAGHPRPASLSHCLKTGFARVQEKNFLRSRTSFGLTARDPPYLVAAIRRIHRPRYTEFTGPLVPKYAKDTKMKIKTSPKSNKTQKDLVLMGSVTCKISHMTYSRDTKGRDVLTWHLVNLAGIEKDDLLKQRYYLVSKPAFRLMKREMRKIDIIINAKKDIEPSLQMANGKICILNVYKDRNKNTHYYVDKLLSGSMARKVEEDLEKELDEMSMECLFE